MSRRFCWVAALVLLAGCSSSDKHPAGVPNECSRDCDPTSGGISSGTPKQDAGKTPAKESGAPMTDLGCFTDPTFGVTLCSGSLLCPGVFVASARNDLAGCGFLDLKNGVADVECLCNGEFLCPITNAANCGTLPGLLSQKSGQEICNQLATNGCFDLLTKPKGDAGACLQDCRQRCAGSPVCLSFCNC